MYTYRNKKNSAFFTSPCVCAGDDWEEVKIPSPKSGKSGKKQESAGTEVPDNVEDDS